MNEIWVIERQPKNHPEAPWEVGQSYDGDGDLLSEEEANNIVREWNGMAQFKVHFRVRRYIPAQTG